MLEVGVVWQYVLSCNETNSCELQSNEVRRRTAQGTKAQSCSYPEVVEDLQELGRLTSNTRHEQPTLPSGNTQEDLRGG